jgi:Flp pilus assembly protein TadD
VIVKSLRIVSITLALLAGAAYLASEAVAQEQDIAEGDQEFEKGDAKSLKKAAKKYDKAIKKAPSLVPPGVYAKRAAIFFLQKRFADGIDFIDKVALKQHPNAPEILEYKALTLWQQGNKTEAIAIADQVAAAKSDAWQAQLLRGNYYYGRDKAKAAEAFEAYLKHRSSDAAKNDARPRLLLGLAYLSLGDNKAAEKQFETVTKQFRDKERWVINANNGLCAAYTANRKFDRAITLCESLIDKRRIDARGSVWFNVGQSYLEKKQARKARQAGQEFIQVQRGKSKGYRLVGDAYYQERDFENALRYYLDAEKRSKAGSDTELLLRLGQTYRSLGRPQEALPKLAAAAATNPENVQIARELGETYLAPQIRDDGKALAAVEKLLKSKESDDELRFIAARALYNQGKLAQAKVRYMEAAKLKPGEVKYRDGLVATINMLAFADHEGGNNAKARRHLEDAHTYNKQSAMTNRNLAVVAIEDGKCDDAIGYLRVLRKSRKSRVVADRLMARAMLCAKKPNKKKALAFYAAAAKGVGDNRLLQAEIHAEWAPLLVSTDLEEAVDKLEFAQQVAGTDPLRGDAISRNLALAYYRRGWKYKNDGKDQAALADFERATRNQKVLKGAEPDAFDFSLALSHLDNGNSKEALKLFNALAKGKQGAYLQAPYDKVGAEFFAAYAEYRSRDLKSMMSAAQGFTRLQKAARGKFAGKVKELIGSSWQFVAAAQYRAGNSGAAKRSLANAQRHATSKSDRALLAHNKEVLTMSGSAVKTFDSMGANPPEALVNLGIAYDRAGQSKQAYDAWVKAKSKNARAPKLQDWIDAKKRIFGY